MMENINDMVIQHVGSIFYGYISETHSHLGPNVNVLEVSEIAHINKQTLLLFQYLFEIQLICCMFSL